MKPFFLLALGLAVFAQPVFSQKMSFQVSVSSEKSTSPLDGRLLLLLSTDEKAEPRFQVSEYFSTQLVFGQDVENWSASRAVEFSDKKLANEADGPGIYGYPIQRFSELKPGWYFVQGLLNRYETFHLKTGQTVKLPPDRGEGQQWNRKPGNLFSKPQKVWLDPRKRLKISVLLSEEIPPAVKPADTEWIKHIEIESKLLTDFYGKPMKLGAHVLLPKDWGRHPEARFPLMIYHGHFPDNFGGFQTSPPDPKMDTTDFSKRFNIYGYNKFQQQEAYDFYKKWSSDTFPRFLVIEIQHPTPYYDDSYAVNSASQGPWGDAIQRELLPFIEKQFRGIGQGWARFMYGGSTGGWEAIAAQIFYPDEYNGCFAACPDPIDFRAYTVVNIYDDKNAYAEIGAHAAAAVERPQHRDYLGHLSSTLRQTNYFELALGSKSRSGQQWDIWEATFSPQAADGYPARLWDKKTGVIDPKIASYWKENYDLGHILSRDWSTLGPKLEGKIHLYCGDMDNYYLNNAVYLVEDFLKNSRSPFARATVEYGDRAEHCWNGDHKNPNYVSRLRYHTMYVPLILKRMAETAPKGADLTSWRY